MAANKVTLNVTGDDELMALLGKLPSLVVSAGGPTDRAIGKAGAIVAQRAREIAPRSSKTGSAKRQSAKSKAIWSRKLRTQIGSKVVRYPTTSVAIIGAKSPYGNKAHFLQEEPRKHVLWGKKESENSPRLARNWITQAFDETRQQQHAAMAASLKKDIDENMKGR